MYKACWRTFYGAKKFQILGNAWEVDVVEQKTHEKPKISNKTVEQNLTQKFCKNWKTKLVFQIWLLLYRRYVVKN
jgi:hypothetical protein